MLAAVLYCQPQGSHTKIDFVAICVTRKGNKFRKKFCRLLRIRCSNDPVTMDFDTGYIYAKKKKKKNK